VFYVVSAPKLYNEVPRITEISVESTRTKMEHAVLICVSGLIRNSDIIDIYIYIYI
jgi:hypothetical protein